MDLLNLYHSFIKLKNKPLLRFFFVNNNIDDNMKKVLITGATSGIMKKFIDKYILVKQLKQECIKIKIKNLNSITKFIN